MIHMTHANLLRAAAAAILLLASVAGAGQLPGSATPSEKDKCPVCGMFVYKYPDWVAQIAFKDGSVVFFDGAKDLFKYYFNLRKYSPGKSKNDIAAVYVMEYYEMKPIDARKAFFVVGSDVYGPMGHELIPLATEADAATFRQDHKGKRILRLEEVTPGIIEGLD